MKGRTVCLDHWKGREAAALMVDGQLDDLLIDGWDGPRPGAIFRAIVDRPVKGQGGVFLKLPDGTAFLRRSKGLAPGAPVLVQVTGAAEPGKAVPVTDRLLFKSRYAIVTPGAPGVNVSRRIKDEEERVRLHTLIADHDHGCILRSCAEGAEADAISADVEDMTALADAVLADAAGTEPEALTEGDSPHLSAWREWTEPAEVVTEPGCFETHGVADAIDALGPRVTLPNATLWIEPTRALVAVDVNTTGAGLAANLATARALPRALRLRGLGGQIVLDLAPMAKKDRRQLENALKTAFRSDPVETSFLGWTPLGHVELSRKRERLPLKAFL